MACNAPLLQNNLSGWTRYAFGVNSRLGDASGHLYNNLSAIVLREVRMAVFQMVMRGREA
jgi:hypothetical protein